MIHIFLDIQESPWGGGNQFLKALRCIYRDQGLYAEELEQAKIVLVNSHHFGSIENLQRLFSFLQNNPDTTLIHRIDGPVTLIRGKDEGTDNLIFRFNELFAAGSIFQSQWCIEHCRSLGMKIDIPYQIIFNAPDPKIFYPAHDKKAHGKIRLMATSWSANPIKGFDVYHWMDENLDWDKYEMHFVGNSDIEFKNIIHTQPVDSKKLADLLRQHDIFVTASRADPCSNSLIEALHCGLPALALRDGGHPELIGEGGILFKKAEEIPALLEKFYVNIPDYQLKINLPSLDEVAQSYLDFMVGVHENADKTHFLREDIKSIISLYKKYTTPSMMRRCVSGFCNIFQKMNVG